VINDLSNGSTFDEVVTMRSGLSGKRYLLCRHFCAAERDFF